MNMLLDLFLTFVKIGLFTFGGGYAMISLTENSCVQKKQWITHDEMMNFIIILLIMVLLKKLLKNPYVQAVLRGLKPCIIGIILATGVYMILQHCTSSICQFSVNSTALIMTAVLAGIYFGSRKIMKKGITPIGLIGISALAGIIVYGL